MARADSHAPTGVAPPHPLLAMAEGRAVFELGAFMALRGALTRLPHGDGHSVLVLPGFLASDQSTLPMRGLLRDLGYDVHGWGLGRNATFNRRRESAMQDVLARINDASGRKVSLIGWSLGGVFARELAKAMPDRVRLVISLGSPISNERGYSNASELYAQINGRPPQPRAGPRRDLETAPPVPTTSILTKSDGVVAWRGSVQKAGGQTENIVVPASHLGLGVNPLVMLAIADRLAQREGAWRPFKMSGLRSFFFNPVRGT